MSDLEHWEERYRKGEIPWDTGRPSVELERLIEEEKIAPCKAIELGCGNGTNAVWLAAQGFDVSAVHLSSLRIELARGRAASQRVRARWVSDDLLYWRDL